MSHETLNSEAASVALAALGDVFSQLDPAKAWEKKDVDIEHVGNILATIREVVERSKLAMVANGREKVVAEDLLIAANGMKRHLSLLAQQQPEPSIEEQVGSALSKLIAKTLGLQDGDEEATVARLGELVGEVHCTSHTLSDVAQRLGRATAANGRKVDNMAQLIDEIDQRTKKILDEVS